MWCCGPPLGDEADVANSASRRLEMEPCFVNSGLLKGVCGDLTLVNDD